MKTKEEWLDDMELRLKRALLDVIDADEDEALRFLQEEVASHLEDLSGDSTRAEYLISLKERFPQLIPDERPSPELDDEFIQQLQKPKDIGVEEALEIVRRDWEQLDEDSRKAFISAYGRHDGAHVSNSVGAAGESTKLENPSDELARYLKLPEDSSIPVERLQTALVGLLKTVSQVDSLGTQVYKQVGMSRELNAEDIRKLVGLYIGSEKVSADQLNKVFDETRLKIGLIISSIANLPSSLSQTHLAKFQPSLIEQSVSGGGGLLSGKEAKYWKKYVALAEDIQPQKLEKVINDLMIQQLKKLKKR